jgi:mRNA interferase MazF
LSSGGGGEVYWADVGDPRGSAPGKRRPVLVVQDDRYNRSRLATVIAVALSSNMALLDLVSDGLHQVLGLR